MSTTWSCYPCSSVEHTARHPTTITTTDCTVHTLYTYQHRLHCCIYIIHIIYLDTKTQPLSIHYILVMCFGLIKLFTILLTFTTGIKYLNYLILISNKNSQKPKLLRIKQFIEFPQFPCSCLFVECCEVMSLS